MSDILQKSFSNMDNNSNSSISLNSQNSSSLNYLPNSIIQYPNIIYSLIFLLSQTSLDKYFEEKEDFISKKCKSNGNYKLDKTFSDFLNALKNLREKDIQSYKKHIKEIIKKYLQDKKEKDSKGENDLIKINSFIFNDLIFKLIKKIEVLQGKEHIIHKEKFESSGEGSTMKKAIQNYKSGIKDIFKEIKNYDDLFASKIIIGSSKYGKTLYKIHSKSFHYFIIKQKPENIKKTTIDDYFDTKKNDKIYQFPEILIFLFEKEKDNDIDYTIKYEKKISLNYFDGEKESFDNFSLYAIIYEEKNNDIQYNIMIKNLKKEKEWKIFDGNEIKEENLSDELCYEKKSSALMLFYKKE